MYAQGLKFFTETHLSVFGLLLFIAVFFSVTVWTMFRAQSKEFYQKIAMLPFAEDTHHE